MVSRRAGFFVRMIAWIFDFLLVGVPLAVVGVTIWGIGNTMFIFSLIFFFLYALLTPIFWTGFTVGKRIIGIQIVVSRRTKLELNMMLTRLFVSGILYLLTFGILLIISALMIRLRHDKRAIHDLLAGTCVEFIDSE